MTYSIGIDVGGTKIRSAAVQMDGTILAETVLPTKAEEGFKPVMHRILHSVEELRSQLAAWTPAGIGVCSPGPVNAKLGRVYSPPNLPGWGEVDLAAQIRASFDLPIVVQNDANAAALAEYQAGAGQGVKHMVYVTVSTGIGGGVIVDGRLRVGATGGFGEIGHMIVDRHGPVCGCGNRGCIEAIASGTALARRATELYERKMDAPELTRLAAAGDPAAKQLLDDAFSALGIALINLVNLYDPERIVIGGGVSQIGDPLFTRLNQALAENSFRGSRGDIPVLPAQLGMRAGVIGAAASVFAQPV